MTVQKQLRAPRGFDTWLRVGRTNLKVHRALNLLLGELDLSLAQHEILLTIRRQSGLTQGELSEQLLVVKSNATALLKKLEARGLVRRSTDPADSRIRRLSLTRAGQALVEKSFAVQTRVVRAMASIMSDKELAIMDEVMRRAGNAIDRLTEKARN
ncbi:MAG: MarR family transcriptional regulator [Gammaproteobacteria bacterium]|nr:MarR family transcriptional regulator [Gammaproteobacteria bacterium]